MNKSYVIMGRLISCFQLLAFTFKFLTLVLLAIPAFSQVPNPFKSVNSAYDEQNPVITPDGKALYFTVANHPQNMGGKKDLGDIWVSLNIDGKWQTPIHGGTILNDMNHNAVAGFSSDGSTVFLLGHYSQINQVSTQGFSYSEKTDTGWSIPQNISIPYFLNRSSMLTGDVNEDGTIFIFSADGYNTTGAEDIYATIKSDGKWSEPINLGKSVNTPFQEMSPMISEDTRSIFFSSNGLKGLGSFDVFTSIRLDDTWTNWSNPVPLGDAINSEARELFYRNGSGHTVFTTTHDSDGYGDIHSVQDVQNQLQVDTLIKMTENKYDENNASSILIKGSVTNSKTGAGIEAKLQFKADSTYYVSSEPGGKYKIRIPSTKVYTIQVEKRGYVNLVERLDIQTVKLNALEMSFKLQPIEVGTLVNLKSVLFYMGTTSLLEESYIELDAVVGFLKTNPKVEIELEGHTDNRGDAKKNVKLSQERVGKIKAYLVSKGVSARRVKGKGFGGSKPIANSDSEEARKLNRRVEFLIVKN
jgi:OmpA-OmpF porin, OOP family